jgi:exodeoxyribonuclease VII small subunit
LPAGPRIVSIGPCLTAANGRAAESVERLRAVPTKVGSAGLTTIEVSRFEMANPSPPLEETAAAPLTYEDALAELERLVAAMEGGQMPLDRLLASYQRGAELLGFCRSRLEAVEQQVKVLEDGQLKVWTEAA